MLGLLEVLHSGWITQSVLNGKSKSHIQFTGCSFWFPHKLKSKLDFKELCFWNYIFHWAICMAYFKYRSWNTRWANIDLLPQYAAKSLTCFFHYLLFWCHRIWFFKLWSLFLLKQTFSPLTPYLVSSSSEWHGDLQNHREDWPARRCI